MIGIMVFYNDCPTDKRQMEVQNKKNKLLSKLFFSSFFIDRKEIIMYSDEIQQLNWLDPKVVKMLKGILGNDFSGGYIDCFVNQERR